MRNATLLALFGIALSCSAHAETACAASALPEAARTVLTVRHNLHGQAVGELDPMVPAGIADQLTRLKNGLAAAAEAAMACASPSASPETLQSTLATALHANLSADSETVLLTKAGKDLGAYGSDLDVQVLPLSNAPRYLEINFRYGVECGDDNLLIVYRQSPAGSAAAWQQVLRWDAPSYHNVGDAFGDFILLTPITGFAEHPNWRVVVAHGQPGCTAGDTRSRFDLDLLQPGTDPAHPQVAWHLEHPYRRGDTPRLATTEETLTFQLIPPVPAKTAPAAQSYRYRISSDNVVQAIDDAPDTASPTAPATEAVMPGSPATATGPVTTTPQATATPRQPR